jgi:hypothetical protein
MLIQEIELGVIDLIDKKKKVVKLKESQVCLQGFRIDFEGNIEKGVPHRNQKDCIRFCFKDTCVSL